MWCLMLIPFITSHSSWRPWLVFVHVWSAAVVQNGIRRPPCLVNFFIFSGFELGIFAFVAELVTEGPRFAARRRGLHLSYTRSPLPSLLAQRRSHPVSGMHA